MSEQLTIEQVRYIARLARLRLTDDAVERYREELSRVLDHVRTLSELDVSSVLPLASPLDETNRFDDDQVRSSLHLDEVQTNAPAVQGPYLAVPKVLEERHGGVIA